MNHSPEWPIRHILIGIPIVLVISYLWGGAMKGWGTEEETILASAALVSVVGAVYTFLITLAERSYYMVFWAREKIKGHLEEARKEGEAKGLAEGLAEGRAKQDRAWRAWYERQQSAQRENRPFDEPPPVVPSSREEE